MSWVTLVLILAGRVFLLLPLKDFDSEFHKRDWIPVLAEKADGLPILFIDSYRDPSKFSFYHAGPKRVHSNVVGSPLYGQGFCEH